MQFPQTFSPHTNIALRVQRTAAQKLIIATTKRRTRAVLFKKKKKIGNPLKNAKLDAPPRPLRFLVQFKIEKAFYARH